MEKEENSWTQFIFICLLAANSHISELIKSLSAEYILCTIYNIIYAKSFKESFEYVCRGE